MQFFTHLKRYLCSWFIRQVETRDLVWTIITITSNCLFLYQHVSAIFFPTTLLYKKYDECMSFHLIWNAIFGISAITLATVYLSDAQQETNGCNTNCSSEWNSQICATNDEGKTKLFPSECVMKSENCLNKSSKFNAFLFRSYLHFYQIIFFSSYNIIIVFQSQNTSELVQLKVVHARNIDRVISYKHGKK